MAPGYWACEGTAPFCQDHESNCGRALELGRGSFGLLDNNSSRQGYVTPQSASSFFLASRLSAWAPSRSPLHLPAYVVGATQVRPPYKSSRNPRHQEQVQPSRTVKCVPTPRTRRSIRTFAVRLKNTRLRTREANAAIVLKLLLLARRQACEVLAIVAKAVAWRRPACSTVNTSKINDYTAGTPTYTQYAHCAESPTTCASRELILTLSSCSAFETHPVGHAAE